MSAALPTEPPVAGIEPSSPRFEFLDGIRGLAALYVVLYHAACQFGPHGAFEKKAPLPGWASAATAWMQHGHYAVGVFIVLSGFCLMLPVAASAKGQLRGGMAGYLKRRGRRILPPYYAALLLSLAVVIPQTGMPVLMGSEGTKALSAGSILSHLLLLHNLRPDWNVQINTPMWSVATEWQIYFLFPLLLLPVWRRWGTVAAVAAGLGVGLAPHFLLPQRLNFDWACPWYAGLFALGMAGAVLSLSGRTREKSWRERGPWGAMALGLLGLLCLGTAAGLAAHLWAADLLVGLGAFCLILACVRQSGVGAGTGRPGLLRVLEHPWALRLGAFSYSLYLTHTLVLLLLCPVLKATSLPSVVLLAALMALSLPLSLLLAWTFYLLFERPFTVRPAEQRSLASGATAAV